MSVNRSHRLLAGSGPAATSFLCFAKERKQRKATTLPLDFGFPIVRVKKWESFETRFAQTTKLSLSIFCLAQLAVSEVDESQNQQQNFQCRVEFKRSLITYVLFLPHVATPIVLGKNGEEESQMFERSEFLTLPHF